MTLTSEIEPTTLAPAPLASTIARVRVADLPYVRGSFSEGHKNAPGVSSMTWRYYKRFVVPELGRVLAHPLTELLGAYHGDQLCSWLALARGRRVDTVHWVATAYWLPVPHDLCLGCLDPKRHTGDCALAPAHRTQIRRRGLMRLLFDHAQLQERLVYTHQGGVQPHRGDRQTMDERLLPWLASRGHKAAYVPWEQWSQ